jgi:hypothetical protein
MREKLCGVQSLRLRVLGSGLLIVSVLVGLAISMVLVASLPADDPYSPINSQWNGTSELVRMGFEPLSTDISKALSSGNRPSVLMIIAPNRQFSQSEAASIREFVQEGGLLVLADNFGSGNGLLRLLNMPAQFDGRVLDDTLFYYKDPIFPIVVHLPSSPFSQRINELVLDRATVLNITAGSNGGILASSTPFSFLDANQNGKKEPEEPSGPFPIMAEFPLGKGTVLVFTSPASFTNGLINQSDNSALIQNIMAYVGGSPSGAFSLDDTHLALSPFTPEKAFARQLVYEILNGGMVGSTKLGITFLALLIITARYMYRKPLSEKEEQSLVTSPISSDVDYLLQLHPSWNPLKLEYVRDEYEAVKRWSRSYEEG